MRIKEFMNTKLKEVYDDATLEHAKYLMDQDFIHHLIVINHEGEMIGILSTSDLGKLDEGELRKLSVRDVMSQDLVTINPDCSIQDAANLMRGHGIHCLPVVDDDFNLLGIISDTDLLDMIGKHQELHYPNPGRRPVRNFPPDIRINFRR